MTSILSKEDVERRLSKLTSFPTTVLRLMALDLSSEEALAQVVEVTETDPALTARLFGIANSAGFAPEVEITNLTQAVARIGMRRVSELIYTVSTMAVFEATRPDQRELWRHALSTAVVARSLTSVWPELSVQSDAYLCGLMHDLGRFVALDGLPEELRHGDEFGWFSSVGLLEAERGLLGRDHAELGYEACQRLGLPARVRTVTRHHHRYGRDFLDHVPLAERDLVSLVQIAEFCASLLSAEPDLLDLEAGDLMALLERRGEHLFHVQAIASLGELAAQLPRMAAEIEALAQGLGV